MRTHPNQRMYKTIRSDRNGKQLISVTKEDMQGAYKILTPNELVIWLDCISNKDGHIWAFSPQDLSNRYGMSVSGARQAFGGLIKKGFATEIVNNRFHLNSRSTLSEHAHHYIIENQQEDW